MSAVKRYRIDSFLGYDPNGPYSSWEEEEDADGDYVKASDYDAALALLRECYRELNEPDQADLCARIDAITTPKE
jgi:hypothetical protein